MFAGVMETMDTRFSSHFFSECAVGAVDAYLWQGVSRSAMYARVMEMMETAPPKAQAG